MEYEDENLIAGAAMMIVIAFLIIAFVGAVLALLDLYRFGRKGAPWRVALAYATLFSGFGYWTLKLPGALPGLFCIWAFQRGRTKARQAIKPVPSIVPG